MQQNETALDTSAKIELRSLSEMESRQRQELGQLLSSQKIFFAHMSVGSNVLSGLKLLGEQYPELQLNIVKTEDPAKMTTPGFYHAPLGFNTDPGKKIDNFQEKIAKIRAAKPDIVFMKLCYVDITASGNSELLFERHAQGIDQLQKQNPSIRFLHWTCPLTSGPVSLKNQFKQAIKSIAGKPTDTDDNLARFQWNKKVIEHYAQDGIFDLAKYESHTLDGDLIYKQVDGDKVPVLVKEYTDDGGHLNQKGQLYIAEQLLFFLAGHIQESREDILPQDQMGLKDLE